MADNILDAAKAQQAGLLKLPISKNKALDMYASILNGYNKTERDILDFEDSDHSKMSHNEVLEKEHLLYKMLDAARAVASFFRNAFSNRFHEYPDFSDYFQKNYKSEYPRNPKYSHQRHTSRKVSIGSNKIDDNFIFENSGNGSASLIETAKALNELHRLYNDMFAVQNLYKDLKGNQGYALENAGLLYKTGEEFESAKNNELEALMRSFSEDYENARPINLGLMDDLLPEEYNAFVPEAFRLDPVAGPDLGKMKRFNGDWYSIERITGGK